MKFAVRGMAFSLLALGLGPALAVGAPLPLEKIQLPPGFRIALYARVPNARSLVRSPAGTLFVGTRRDGRVFALRDRDGDRRAEEIYTLARGLDMPNGVAFRQGDLYVAEVHRILRFPDIEAHLDAPPQPQVISDRYPRAHHHGWKFIAFGPDGRLYVPIGAPCNICVPPEPRFATITRINPDGSGLEIVARGVRNTVGFDWDPRSGQLWFTDNGRDWMGDDTPPDELNRLSRPGLHFGYPYCHGEGIPDPELGADHDCRNFEAPARALGPHVAALGMHFYRGVLFPARYRNQIFIAEHGSWNRTQPVGYRVMLVRVEKGRALSYEVFARGWLDGGRAWGRPVALEELEDGSLLVSDDRAGAIYRISYRKESQTLK